MMKAYSDDLRQRVLEDWQNGDTFVAIAARYRVSATWVRQFIRRYEETGEISPRSRRNHRQGIHILYEKDIRQALTEKPDHTLASLRHHLGLECSLPHLWYVLELLGISFKKKQLLPRNSNGQTSFKNAKSSRRSSN
jgi:transposase